MECWHPKDAGVNWGHEPGRIGRSRDSVLECGSPLPLSVGAGTCQSARGLAQSKTWRTLGRFLERLALGLLNLSAGLFVLVASSGAWAANAEITIFSRGSGQFVIHGAPSAAPYSAMREAGLNNSPIRVEPALLAVTCDRVKQALLRELDCPDQWRGKIHFFIRFTPIKNPQVTIQSQFYSDGWQGQVEVPDEIQPDKLVRTIVQVLLLEMANRTPGSGLAEIPLWLTEGLTQLLLRSVGPNLVLQPQTRLLLRETKADPLLSARIHLRQRQALSFSELSLPATAQFAGEAWENYQDGAVLLVHELRRLPNGRERLLAMLSELPQCLNWQTAFYRAFHSFFQQPIDVEKWWAVAVINAAGREQWQSLPTELTLEKLDAVLRLSVQVRPTPEALPAPANLTLQEFIQQWEYAAQRVLLPSKIGQLAALHSSAAPQLAPLIHQYREALQWYLQQHSKSGADSLAAAAQPIRPILLVRRTVQKLNALDKQREVFRSELLAASTNAPTTVKSP
jgi:hypothetical protein